MRREYSAESLLSPYRLLDLTDEKGFLCGKILGDLGADVIKVERVGGDPARAIAPFYHDTPHPEKSLFWFAYNTSKRGITLDIESRDGQAIFRRLVKTADAVIESFPVRYMDKLGLGYGALSEINPQIVVTSITPFGQTGPYKAYKTCDLTAQAIGSFIYTTGEADGVCLQFAGAESRQAYLQAGANAAVGTLIALYARQVIGRGQHVDVSIAECTFWANWGPVLVLRWQFQQDIVRRVGQNRAAGKLQLRGIFPCKDGYVAFGVMVGIHGHMTRAIVEWMDSEGMAEDLTDVDWSAMDIMDCTQDEIEHWEEVIARFFITHTRAELNEEAVKRGFILFPCNEPRELLHDQQINSREFFIGVPHPELGTTIVYPGAAYKSSLGSPAIRFRAPLIGEHNEEIYCELGISKEELVMLKQTGVI